MDGAGGGLFQDRTTFRGELEFENIKPDGYLFISGEHLFFEFLGERNSPLQF